MIRKKLYNHSVQTRTTSANGEEKPIGAQVGLGTRVASNTTSYTQGALLEDESKSAFAIEGNGFFQVRGADGTTYYTRNGNFNWSIGPTGTTLTNTDGYPVLDSNGNTIVLPNNVNSEKAMFACPLMRKCGKLTGERGLIIQTNSMRNFQK